jgi:DNA-directed RNA polymerase subunit beta'
LLERIDLDELSYDLRHKANTETSQQRKNEAFKRLQVVESFRESKGINKPEWMIVKVVPVITSGLASFGAIGWWSFCHFRLE